MSLSEHIRSQSCVEARRDVRFARGFEQSALRGGPDARLLADIALTHWLGAAVHLLRALDAAALLLCLAIASPASAQSDETLLVRTTWSECGYDCSPPEVAALHHVISGLAEREGWRYATAWRELSPRLAAGTSRRRWLSSLSTECREPRDWPRIVHEHSGRIRPHPPWTAFVDRCGSLVEVVRAVVAGDVASPCRVTPEAWGDSRDLERREPLSARTWEEADCGPGLRLHFGRWR